MVVDVRKLSNGAGLARPVYQHGHFCVRAFHLLLSYPGYSFFLFFLIYLQIMDFILYYQIRSRGPLAFTSFNSNNTLMTSPPIHIFDPLPIKKIMMEPAVQYVRSPLAESVETKLHFTYYFPYISPNAISFFHCLLSLISMKFFASESLFRRQLGVVIFQFRIFLDCLDGVVFRAHTHSKRYKSHYGDFGYYVDAISDILGGTCLILGCLFYFYKQRPFRVISTRSNVCFSSAASDGGSEETDMMILNLEDEQPSSRTHSPSTTTTTTNEIDNNLLETKQTIFNTLLFFSFRYILAGMFWDRDVHAYEDLLDSPADTPQQQALQLSVLHSPLTILIFYLWRYICALSIQDCLLFAIFIDRTWEFVQKTSRISWYVLLLTICLTELHIDQVRSLFTALATSKIKA